MSSSQNGGLLGQIIKGVAAVVIAVFTAKKGHDKWKDNKKS